LCAKEGIRQDLIASHNQQKNGVVGRKNISIVGFLEKCCMTRDFHYLYGNNIAIKLFTLEQEPSQNSWNDYT